MLTVRLSHSKDPIADQGATNTCGFTEFPSKIEHAKDPKRQNRIPKGKNTEEQKSENPIRYQVHGTRKMQHTGVASHRQTITIRQGTTERLNLYRRGNRDKTQVKQTRGINKTQEKQIRQTIRDMIGNR